MKKENGITLTRLILIIAVLLIILGISGYLLQDGSGIIDRAQGSVNQNYIEETKTKIKNSFVAATSKAYEINRGKLTKELLETYLAKEFGNQEDSSWKLEEEENGWIFLDKDNKYYINKDDEEDIFIKVIEN